MENTPKPRIILGGKHIRCETQVVDYNPTLFFIEPNYAKAEPGSAELPERLSVVKIVGNAKTLDMIGGYYGIRDNCLEVKEGDTPEILQKRVMREAEWIILPEAVEAVCKKLSNSTEEIK